MINIKATPIESFDYVRDRSTPEFLLPSIFVQSSNTEDFAFMKIALTTAVDNCLTEEQADLIKLCYWDKKTKVQIAREYGVAHSTISKKIKKAEEVLKKQVEYAMLIYQTSKKNMS